MSMISGQIDELRTAAQTYRRLGNHSAESMLLDAADTIWQLRDDLQRANAENTKMREQIDVVHMSRLLTENENDKLRELCADMLSEDMDQHWPEFTRRALELGVEVEQ